jgi:small subunit ribosomal protein S18
MAMMKQNRKKVCRFCADPKATIDYKDVRLLQNFITDRGKIVPRRISGNCATHQRAVQTSVKRARVIALLPFSTVGI